jgi:DNA-binding FrmR family transcriptional regulator
MPKHKSSPKNNPSHADEAERGALASTPLELNEVSGKAPRHAVAMTNKAELGRRLKRIEGQVRGVAQMVADERYCPDILAQLSAIDAALAAVGQGLVANHLRHCARHALHSDDEATREAMIDELIHLLRRR